MSNLEVFVNNETSEFIAEVSETVLATLPIYPGSESAPTGPLIDAVVAIDGAKANKTDVAPLSETNALKEGQEALRQSVTGLDGRVGGISDDLQSTSEAVSALDSKVSEINVAGTNTVTINSSNELVYGYSDSSSKNFGFFPAPKGYKGTATAKPTAAGAVGDWYANVGSSDIVWWLCTTAGTAGTAGAAGVAVWTARGGKVFEDMPFEFTTNDTYDYPVATARTIKAPLQWGAAATVAFSYSVSGGGFTAVASWPLSMAAQSVLRATVTGLTAGTKRYAAAERTG